MSHLITPETEPNFENPKVYPAGLGRELVAYMTDWMLLEERPDGILLYPGVGKWTGRYPASWREREDEDA